MSKQMGLQDEVGRNGRSLGDLIANQFGDWQELGNAENEPPKGFIRVEWDFTTEGLGVYRGRVYRDEEGYYTTYEIDFEVNPPRSLVSVIPAEVLARLSDRCKGTVRQHWRRWNEIKDAVEYIGFSSRGVLHLEVMTEQGLMSVTVAENGRIFASPISASNPASEIYYVDIPTNEEAWKSVSTFDSFEKACAFADDVYGSVYGWANLITG